MSFLDKIIHRVAQSELQETVDNLLALSKLNIKFFVFLALSAGIATLGLLEQNTAVVIGAMVLAPLLTPLLCFSLGILALKKKMILYGISAVLLGTILSILISAGMVLALDRNEIPGQIIDLYSFHTVEFLLVALFAGMAGAYSSFKTDTKDELIGVAIAAALIPPLAFAGIALGIQEMKLFKNTISLYGLSILSTTLGAMVIYAIYLVVNKVKPEKIKEDAGK